ncbi:MAG: TonB-dependent receptor [Burkholderiales bacterium]|nr:TonB-dependent receptor [Burkholderiales bacterium]
MTSSFKPLAISLAVAAVFPASFAFAQSVSFVSASSVIVTAGRQTQAAKDVLADNVVISAEEIARSGAASIVDLLQQQRGIEISRTGGPGNTSSVFMRGGNNTQNVVLVDGVRIGSSTTGGATWSAIPLSQIDHIEIVYGPLSSLYGADAMGGVIQVFTKKSKGALTPTFAVGAGSYGARKAQAGISGAASEHVSLALNVAHDEDKGFSATRPAAGPYSYNADKDGFNSDSVSGHLNWELAKGFDLGANFLQNRLNAQFDAGPSYDDHNVQKLETAAVYGKAKVNDIWTATLQYAQTSDKTDTDASYGKSRINSDQSDWSLQNDILLGKDVLQLIAETREEKVDTTTLALNRRRTTDSYAASYVLKRDAHLASVSLRRDRSSSYGWKTTGSIAYGYRISPALRVNASYGNSFRAPTFNELYYPGYGIDTNKPEKAKNAEIGVYFEQGDTQFSAVAYQNKATDLLVSTNVCPVQQASHPYGCAYNVNQATLSGLTIGASTRIADLTLRGSLDLQDPKDDTTGLRLARRAKQHGTLAAEYALAKAKVGVETVFSGERYDDVPNKKLMGGYSLLNFYGSVEVMKNLTLVGRWNNVLNKDYELAKNYATPGSNLFVGLNYGFR